jgi:hypothetical protein
MTSEGLAKERGNKWQATKSGFTATTAESNF